MTIKEWVIRIGANAALAVSICLSAAPAELHAQATSAVTQSLLDKAHALEVRGRMDMAAQTWQQVLLTDPNNTDALGGLARAAKLDGNAALTNTYLEKLRAINPNDPNIARVEGMGTQQNQMAQLQQAGKLAQAGQYAQAMVIYRQVFGSTPPPGDWSLAYYETESATEDGRPHAIGGLRALVEKFPTDSRYQVALGRILTYNPKTREEGRKLLEKHPHDPQAVEALRQSLLWDSANPASAGEIRAYLAAHHDTQLAQALKNQPRAGTPGTGRKAGAGAPTAEQAAAIAANRAKSAEEIAAYKALNAKKIDEAETDFKAILAKEPENPRALAGMGYVRMQQSNFSGAISFLEQAKHDNSNDPGLDAALDTSRFWFMMGEGQTALNENDLINAEKQYRAALALRPNQPDALEGLGGILLKAQQPGPAIPVYETFTHAKPDSPAAWRGLFLAQLGSGNAPLALVTEKRIPAAVHAQLMKDPLFLRSLASAYSSVGRDADAERVLRSALDLPFPADAKGVKADTQLQYASLLLAANHLDQAVGLYRQVLADDHDNAAAWQGLIQVEHTMGHDQEALTTVESMPPATYALAMKDPGFETTVASIYQDDKKLDIAQELLEKAVAQQTTAGQKPSVMVQMQLAGIYLQRGNAQLAYPIYQQVLTDNPDRADAWSGLISALHTSGHDKEAVAQVQLIPAPVRATLEQNVDFLQTMGAVYGSLGQSSEALTFLTRVQRYYAAQNSRAPADVEIQDAWLLYNGMSDTGLYRQLMALGGRPDLTDDQRRTVQTIWTNWAVRRANQATAAGNSRRALAILNATAHSFPDNPGVIKALANGYAKSGQPQQAVLIYKAQDMTAASAGDYKAAVGAALAANDQKDAETWLRFGLAQYPDDPQMLILGAKFEQARGDSSRAIDYYHASLKAMPPPDPGAELATELSLPSPTVPVALPSNTTKQPQDLSTLLAPGMSDLTPAGTVPPTNAPPYLPSYGNVYGVGQPPVVPGGYYVPQYMTNPAARPMQPEPDGKTRLKDYVPHAAMGESPLGKYQAQGTLEVAAVVERTSAEALGESFTVNDAMYQPAPALSAAHTSEAPVAPEVAEVVPEIVSPQGYQQQQVARLTTQAQTVSPLPPSAVPAAAPSETTAIPAAAPTPLVADLQPVAPPAVVFVQLGDTTTHPVAPRREITDVLPTARYVVNAPSAASTTSSHPDIAAAQAASIRRHQSDTDSRTGQSNPPEEEYSTAPLQNAQYTPQPQYQPQNQNPNQPQYQPRNQTQTTQPQGQSQNSQYPPQNGQYPQLSDPGNTGDQQYPQPRTGTPAPTYAAPAAPRRTIRRAPAQPAPVAAAAPAAPAPETPAPAQAALPPMYYPSMGYPGVGQPLSGQPYPIIGPAYPLGPAPTDSELMARSIPPLRGYYDAQAPMTTVPLTPRQQAELDLATLEGSYSGWVGGTGIGRYRSGTPGLDRLYDLEAPVEASAVIGQGVRLTVVPKAVFLNSGILNTANFSGTSVPYLGTLPASATTPPAQQFSSGVGGELQLTTRNLGLAAGYTPYEFLVQNITGRFRWRPLGGHFTLFGDRDSVKDTQLSYAGLRDPGSVSPTFAGNIWGGVISTGGGVRLDLGKGASGFYVSADGGILRGYHVLDNNKFEGSMGVYFNVKNFPQIGSLTIGGALFGMHYAHNELGLTYGQGGYFSPDAYFLASVPITFSGYYKSNFHYTLSGAVGVQTFQQDSASFYPLDPGLQTSALAGCPLASLGAHNCGAYPVSGNTGFNYGINAEAAYRFADHWYGGAFISGNNTNNYNTVSGGFFFRYVFRAQHSSEGYPTGLFPVEGFRPLQVP
jgi:tetratricopeptide (TPR) repeat protein